MLTPGRFVGPIMHSGCCAQAASTDGLHTPSAVCAHTGMMACCESACQVSRLQLSLHLTANAMLCYAKPCVAHSNTHTPSALAIPMQILYRMSLHLKIDMIQLLYEKSVRVTSAVKSDMGVGAIVNLQSNDAAKLWGMPLFLHIVWNGPFQVSARHHAQAHTRLSKVSISQHILCFDLDI